MAKVKFNNKEAVFFAALRERVDGYFKQNKIEQTGNFKLFSKIFLADSSALARSTPDSIIVLATLPTTLFSVFSKPLTEISSLKSKD